MDKKSALKSHTEWTVLIFMHTEIKLTEILYPKTATKNMSKNTYANGERKTKLTFNNKKRVFEQRSGSMANLKSNVETKKRDCHDGKSGFLSIYHPLFLDLLPLHSICSVFIYCHCILLWFVNIGSLCFCIWQFCGSIIIISIVHSRWFNHSLGKNLLRSSHKIVSRFRTMRKFLLRAFIILTEIRNRSSFLRAVHHYRHRYFYLFDMWIINFTEFAMLFAMIMIWWWCCDRQQPKTSTQKPDSMIW